MAKLEDVLPALREGKKIRNNGMSPHDYIVLAEGCLTWGHSSKVVARPIPYHLTNDSITRTDWEVLPESVRVADYFVVSSIQAGLPSPVLWEIQTHPIDSEPAGSVLVPGTERHERSECVPGSLCT